MLVTNLFIDLDGTLYTSDNGMWEAIAGRMEKYMYEVLNLPKEQIPQLRQNYYLKYGTTLRGLQENFSINQLDYLKFVHDIPVSSYLSPDKKLRKMLMRIHIPKWIFTNSDHSHSIRVLKALEIDDLIDGIIDVTCMGFTNKPEPSVYKKALTIAGNPPPSTCIMFEDIPRNLYPAKKIGMITVLVGKQLSSSEIDYQIATIHQANDVINQLSN